MSGPDAVRSISLNDERFISLLTKLVGESERLQNNPAQGLIPREDCASDHILELLSPFDKKNGGVLEIEVPLLSVLKPHVCPLSRCIIPNDTNSPSFCTLHTFNLPL